MTPGKTYIIEDPRINEGRHQKWMKLAFKFAKRSKFPGARMAAIVVVGGKISSWGVNKAQNGHLKSKHYTENQAHHAELSAVLAAGINNIKGATIYVAGYTPGLSKSEPCWSSRPCESCQAMLSEAGVKAVIFHGKQMETYVWKAS